jgi:acyl-coenzyme A thioesterase PaaI-like protein
VTLQPSPSRAALGAAIRQLGHDVVGHESDEVLLAEIAAVLRECSDRLRAGQRRARQKEGFHEHWESSLADGDTIPCYEDRPVSGAASPWSVEPDIRRDGDAVIARVTFHAAHEGAPERCHGGVVAALFDDIFGCVLSLTGDGAFTGELGIRYNAPVPLFRELVCRCRLDRRDGRKLYMTGELSDGDTVVTTATALFIQPRQAPTQSTFDPA